MNRSIIVLLLLITIGVLQIQCSSKKSEQEKKEKTELEAFCEKINTECPIKFNSSIKLEGARVVATNVLEYNFRVTDDLKWINDTANIAIMKEAYIYDILYNNKMAFIKQSDITISYLYRDNKDSLLLKVDIKPIDYNDFDKTEITDIFSEIEKTVNITQANLPTEIGPDIYIVEINAERPAILEYQVQMRNVSKEVFDAKQFAATNKSANIQHIKNDGSSTKFRRNNVTFRYVYFDKDMNRLCEIEITPNDYK